MQVDLFKRNSTYKKDGEEKVATNFYVKCGDTVIPIQVRFFENEKGSDPNYSGRKLVLSSFASILPEKVKNGKNVNRNEINDTANLQELKQDDLPF